MPDTGAPWNIPYAAPADLVRDWPDLSEDVAEAVAAGLSATGSGGIGSNVVQTVKLDDFTSSSTSFVDVTGLSATITPSSASARVLVIVQVNGLGSDSTGDRGVQIRIAGGNAGDYIGDASGTQTRSLAGVFRGANAVPGAAFSFVGVYLDSPATAAPLTYDVQARADSGTVLVGRAQNNGSAFSSAASSITLIEVAP